MVRLTPAQLRRAEDMLAGNATLGATADVLGLPFHAVVLGVYGGGAAWEPLRETDQATERAPYRPAVSTGDDGNGLRTKGKAVCLASNQPSVGSRESGSLAEDGSTQCEDGASPAPPPEPPVVASPPPPERRYRLRNELGEYLHKSGRGMTRAIIEAWAGTNAQLEEALRRVPHLKDLDVEAVPMSKESA